MLKQLDFVELINGRIVKYVSGPKGRAASPKGHWSVVGFIGTDVILAKDQTIIRVPFSNVRKIASYDVKKVLERVETAGQYFKVIEETCHAKRPQGPQGPQGPR
jgi:hypothetical protein